MSIHKRTTKRRGTVYDVRVRTADGKPYTRTFRTRREAETFERNELTARDRGDWVDPKARGRTFRDIAEEWAKSNPSKRSSTVARDSETLRNHLLPAFGDRRLGAIVPLDVQGLIGTMGATLAPATVVRNINVAAAIFRYAVDRDYIAKSPMRTVRRPTVGRAKTHTFTTGELAALVEKMPDDSAPMVWLGALLGLRWGEVAALHVADVDVLGRQLHVRHTLTRDGKGHTSVGAPKSDAGTRSFALAAPLADVLAAHIAAAGLTGADADALVFADDKGGPLIASNWRSRVWVPAVVAAGLGTVTEYKDEGVTKTTYDGPTFHDLRRTYTTGLVDEGVDIKTAQTLLGHAQARLTLEVYAQAVSESQRRASDTIAARLMPNARWTRDETETA